jgi:predicted kinase
LIDAITPHGFDHLYRPVYAAAEDAIARAGLVSGHTVIVDRTNRTRTHRERWLRLAREFACPAIAVEMRTSAAICRERNRLRTDHRRLREERMDRMIAAMQPVAADEGFAAIYDGDTIDLAGILQKEENLNEYCHKAR